MPPTVSFTGPILGSGHDLLLQDQSTAGLDHAQQNCCGFVQLSTFIAPGNPDRPPFRGFHPFCVFVMFPVHVNPWQALCKKMAAKQTSPF